MAAPQYAKGSYVQEGPPANAGPLTGPPQKCKTPGCEFLQSTDPQYRKEKMVIDLDYCCTACRLNAGHGKFCQQKLSQQGQTNANKQLGTQGFRLVPAQHPEIRVIQEQFMKVVDPTQLNKGRDAQSYPRKYTSLQVHACWKLEVPDRVSIYEAQKNIIKREMDQVKFKGGGPQHQNKFQHICSKKMFPAEQTLDESVNESWFLHGTNPQFVLPILQTGLNERLTNVNGMFGPGVYLAEDAEKIDQYCIPDSNGSADITKILTKDHGMKLPAKSEPGAGDLFYCFVVRALRGIVSETEDGKVNMKTNQPLHTDPTRRELQLYPNNSTVRYHSLQVELGKQIMRYREFVLYNANRVNIRYLVAFKRV